MPAERLEREGIHCNLTLLFSFAQAVACADAGVTLISPFVGRIYDWYQVRQRWGEIARDEDPGVSPSLAFTSTTRSSAIATQVMGASFRKTTQILDLAGCDLLTISPELLGALASVDGEVAPRLDLAAAKATQHVTRAAG